MDSLVPFTVASLTNVKNVARLNSILKGQRWVVYEPLSVVNTSKGTEYVPEVERTRVLHELSSARGSIYLYLPATAWWLPNQALDTVLMDLRNSETGFAYSSQPVRGNFPALLFDARVDKAWRVFDALHTSKDREDTMRILQESQATYLADWMRPDSLQTTELIAALC